MERFGVRYSPGPRLDTLERHLAPRPDYLRAVVSSVAPDHRDQRGGSLGTFGPNAVSALSPWIVVTRGNRIDHEVGVLDEPDDLACGRDDSHHASRLADVATLPWGFAPNVFTL